MSQVTVIQLTNVSIRRSGRPVLKGINWTTRPGEHWFIMGTNGSGKSTLMELLMGYLWPQEGTVSVLGREFGRTSLPELRKLVGCVSPWIFDRMPGDAAVKDVVASGFDASVEYLGHETPAIKRAVRRWLGFFGSRGLKERPFSELSSGQQLKVILARALVHDPTLLILDEPFSLLDIGTRVRMYAYLEKLARRRGAPQLILVTHHREDILPIFSQGLILKNGKVVSMGARDKVLAPPALARAFGVPVSTVKRYFL